MHFKIHSLRRALGGFCHTSPYLGGAKLLYKVARACHLQHAQCMPCTSTPTGKSVFSGSHGLYLADVLLAVKWASERSGNLAYPALGRSATRRLLVRGDARDNIAGYTRPAFLRAKRGAERQKHRGGGGI